MLLQLTGKCAQLGHQINIIFVNDMNDLVKHMKTSERILWVSYGASLDVASFDKVFEKTEVTIFPAVKEGIDWDQFSKAVRENSNEPSSQSGLHFDTEIDQKIGPDTYSVKSAAPVIWLIDCKVLDKLRSRKGEGVKLPSTTPELFQKFKDCGLKIQAYTKAEVLMHYSHECVGSMLEVAGVSCQKVN